MIWIRPTDDRAIISRRKDQWALIVGIAEKPIIKNGAEYPHWIVMFDDYDLHMYPVNSSLYEFKS